MKNAKLIIIVVLSLFVLQLSAQDAALIYGEIGDEDAAGNCEGLIGANVYWLGTESGTTTIEEGSFALRRIETTNQLVISYLGYQSDTVAINEEAYWHLHLNASVQLGEVEVVHKNKSTTTSFINPIKVESMGVKELQKAACCSLSESFETNPSIDVAFTDAVTGTRQIQMLGLAGVYSVVSREAMPYGRGLNVLSSLAYTPGAWLESIQLNKGAGPVLNGYESIAGQINAEIKKPESSDQFFLNIYGNQGGRMEINTDAAFKVSDKLYTNVLLHAANKSVKWDQNDDSFLDMPLSKHIIGMNRWKYIGDVFRAQFNVKGTFVDAWSGQTDFDKKLPSTYWGMTSKVNRIEAWGKVGRIFVDEPWKTYGLQVSASLHDQQYKFGNKVYDANQKSYYANFIYQSIIDNTNHGFKMGANVQYDDYIEALDEADFDRVESSTGAYFEYCGSFFEKLNIVAGIRADYHNLYQFFVTPRLHMRYAPNDDLVIRLSAGRGQRTANLITDNIGVLASSRNILFKGTNSDYPFGLDPEVAWNYGLNFTQTIKINQRDLQIGADFYRTDFTNQAVMNLERASNLVIFDNLDGQSYSNSMQIQADYELLEDLDVRIAWRWFDVHTSYDGTLLQKPLIAAHRAFANIGYEAPKGWKFDYTVSWQGRKRIPPAAIQFNIPDYSKPFVMMSAQVTKSWGETFDVYFGGENLTNFRQDNPILGSDSPFGPDFDASLIWGPVFGRNLYLGLRYRIK